MNTSDKEVEELKFRLALSRSGLPKTFWFVKPEDWKGDFVIKDFSEEESYYFHGSAGTGKTMMACLCGKEILKKFDLQKKFRFVTAPEFLLEITLGFKDGTNGEALDRYSFADFLILDDLGVEKASPWAIEQLYILISRRENNMLPLIITSNLTIAEIANSLGNRIASRIVGLCGKSNIICFSGEDKRLRKK